MGKFLVFLVFVFGYAEIILDGETKFGEIHYSIGESHLYEYTYVAPSDKDLKVFATKFSDFSELHIYIGNTTQVSYFENNYKSNSLDFPSISIPSNQLIVGTLYYILIHCLPYCRYSISLTQNIPLSLEEGVPTKASLDKGQKIRFKYITGMMDIKTVVISVKFQGQLGMYVFKGIEEATAENTLPINYSWINDLVVSYDGADHFDNFQVTIFAEGYSEFTVLALCTLLSPIHLQPSVHQTGSVTKGTFQYYLIYKDPQANHMEISLAIYSGDADLYVSFFSYPDLSHYDFKTNELGNDFLVFTEFDFGMHSFTNGPVYIGVYGAMGSVFSIVATINAEASIAIFEGIPVDGEVKINELKTFYYEILKEPSDISIYLTSTSGDADLYVKFGSPNCDITLDEVYNSPNISYSQGPSNLQTLDFRIPENSCELSNNCAFAIGVFGVKTSYYSLTLATKTTHIILQAGKSFIMSSPEQGYRYYDFSSHNVNTTEISFIVTPVYGNPDLYVSKNSTPSINSYEKSSTNSFTNIEKITYIKGKDGLSLEGKYRLAVFSNHGTYYSILATEMLPNINTTIQLYPGYPQKDTLFNTQGQNYKIYSYNFPIVDGQPTLYIYISSLIGRFSIYIANNNNNIDWDIWDFNYNWHFKSSNYGSIDVITIDPNDPDYRIGMTYIIMIVADKFDIDDTASYYIEIASGSDSVMLGEDVSVPGKVANGIYKYYSFPVHYLHEDLSITLMVLSGDPDLYISFNYSNPKPNKSDYDIKSNEYGSEVINLLWEETLSKLCPDLRENYIHGESHGCFMFIGIVSEISSSYNIRVHPSTQTPKFLASGHSIYGAIVDQGYDFYYTQIDIQDPLSIILQKTSGYMNFYLTIQDKNSLDKDPADWQRPNEDTSIIKNQNLITEDIILSSQELSLLCTNVCIVLISIKCQSQDCEFTLDINQDEIFSITEGQAKYGIVGKSYKYYSYICEVVAEDITFIITPINSCEPMMFVSKGSDKRPTKDDYDWTSNIDNMDNVVIKSPNDMSDLSLMKGIYIVGVISNQDACSYTLTVTNHYNTVVFISSGVPQQGLANSEKNSYYVFYNQINEDLIFTITPKSGSPSLVVNSYMQGSDDFYENLPSFRDCMWNSNFEANKYSIRIKIESKGYCVNCYYLIGVISEMESSYTITVTNDLTIHVLQNGVPFLSQGKLNHIEVYSFQVHMGIDIHISLSEFGSENDFYVSDTYLEPKVLWRCEKGISTKTLVIKSDEPLFYEGVYYIIVENQSENPIYTILWYNENSPIKLIDGWPIQCRLKPEADSNILMRFESYNSVNCYLESLTPGFYPTVKAKYNRSTFSSYDLIFNSSSYTENHLAIGISLTGKNLLYLTISNPQSSNAILGEFQLYCTNAFYPALLQSNKLSVGILNNDTNALRYEVQANKAYDMNIYIIPCVGEFEIEVSTNWTIITEQSPQVIKTRLTDGVLFGQVHNAIGKYYITVSKFQQNTFSVFQILVDTFNLPRLYPGNEGYSKWKNGPDGVFIEWSELEYYNHTAFDGEAKYRVYFTEDQNKPMLTSCQVFYGAMENSIKLVGSSEKTEKNLDIKARKGKVVIVADIEASNKIALKTIIYNAFFIENIPPKEKSKIIFTLVILVIIIIFAVAVSGVLYFKFRKEKTEKENIQKDIEDGSVLDNIPMKVKINDSSILNEPSRILDNPRGQY
ncbi:hypothetical protein SteCoe_26193 [Stentor coeruleus]|uniref:Uncharacterized protein n=1 Tax=Stentor coeruleus TaxID=5963 RepID=A0A1R2BDI2_9CILI|nr:hypothetical protein SteCoe_26193 [Stentor coeruleus]